MDSSSSTICGSRNKSTKRTSKRKVYKRELRGSVLDQQNFGTKEVPSPYSRHVTKLRCQECNKNMTAGNRTLMHDTLIAKGVWSRTEKARSGLCAYCYAKMICNRDQTTGERIYTGYKMMSFHTEDSNAMLGSTRGFYRNEDCG